MNIEDPLEDPLEVQLNVIERFTECSEMIDDEVTAWMNKRGRLILGGTKATLKIGPQDAWPTLMKNHYTELDRIIDLEIYHGERRLLERKYR